MARTTRSTTTQEKEKTIEPVHTARKGGNKKRKRNSVADSADQPAAKQSRVDEDVKEEGSQVSEEQQPAEITQPELPSSGDVPIPAEDAEKILEILELCVLLTTCLAFVSQTPFPLATRVDTQGLLDRVFPLPTEHGTDSNSTAGPSTGTQSYSFRALLKSPSTYPLRVLRVSCRLVSVRPV